MFIFFFIFFLDSPTEVTRGWIVMHNGSKHAESRKDVPFWGPTDGLGGQISPKSAKWPIGTFGLKMI